MPELTLENADVPDLIEALADRFATYDIDPPTAILIARDMLAEAMEYDEPTIN